MLQKWHLTESVINESCAPNIIFLNEKNIWNNSDDFWHRKLIWKSEFRDLHGHISNRPLICRRVFYSEKVAIYHSIKVGFEGPVAKKFLNGIYYRRWMVKMRFSFRTVCYRLLQRFNALLAPIMGLMTLFSRGSVSMPTLNTTISGLVVTAHSVIAPVT